MNKGFWICKNCETQNDDGVFVCEVCGATLPHIVSFDYDEIVEGEITGIRWTADACSKVVIEYDGLSMDVTGKASYSILLSKGNAITFHLFGENGKRDQRFILDKYAVPIIADFRVQEGDVFYQDSSITLEWEVRNASQVTIDKSGDFKQKLSGNCTVKLDSFGLGEHCFTIKAENGSSTETKTIHITIVPTPSGKFASDKLKCRKGKDPNVTLNWDIKNAQSVKLKDGTSEYSVDAKGERTVKIEDTTQHSLLITGLDGIRIFKKEIKINVYEESEVEFIANRLYSLPNVPVVLAWNVKNARNVALETKTGLRETNLVHSGSTTITFSEDTVCKLIVEDEFDTKEYPLTIRMLPLPSIKTVMAPAPSIVNTLNIEIKQPKIDIQLNIPQIKIQSVDLKMPFVKSLKELDTDVKLKYFTIERLGAWARIRNLFDIYFNRK